MDLDGDGHRDVLTGSFHGELYWFRGGPDGLLAPELLRDEAGELVRPAGDTSVEAHDLDGDGDLDLVVGAGDKGVFRVENVGTRTAPKWARDGFLLRTRKGEPLRGHNAHLADWDGDGRIDVVAGAGAGSVVWYRNVGRRGKLVFDRPSELLEAPAGFGRRDAAPQLRPGSRTKVHVADWNADGKPDLLVGDMSTAAAPKGPLTHGAATTTHGYVWLLLRTRR